MGSWGAVSCSGVQLGANRSFINNSGFVEGAVAGDARGLGVLEGRREAVRAPVRASVSVPVRAW